MLLTEKRLAKLVDLATHYAKLRNLNPTEYLLGMLNPDTLGESDASTVTETLIRYHTRQIRQFTLGECNP